MEEKLNALEEEMSILKGEIKSILQEVRTAVLAAENPFAPAAQRAPASPVLPFEAEPLPALPAIVPSAPPVSDWPGARSFQASEEQEDDLPPPALEPAPTEGRGGRKRRLERPSKDQAVASEGGSAGREKPAAPPATPRTSLRSLPSLLAWVEATRERLDEPQFALVLGFARYAGLIDSGLEELLTRAGALVPSTEAQEPATAGECIVAIRQLDTLLAQKKPVDLTVVRRGRRMATPPRREVRTSRRR